MTCFTLPTFAIQMIYVEGYISGRKGKGAAGKREIEIGKREICGKGLGNRCLRGFYRFAGSLPGQ
jgi:hypothetical protein